MKRYATFALFLTVVFIVRCHIGLGQASERERLEAKLRHHGTLDTIRIRILIDLGGAWRDTDTERSLRHYIAAENLARSLRSHSHLATALMMRGWLTARMGKMVEGAELIAKASHEFRLIHDSAGLMRCMNTEAGLLSMQGKHASAIQVMQPIAAYYSARRDTIRLSPILSNLGSCYTYLGDKRMAIQYRERTLALAEARNDTGEIATTLMHIGILQDDPIRKLEYYERAELLLVQHDDINALAHLYNNMGRGYQDAGQLEKALQKYERSMELAERLKSQDILTTAVMNLSGLYRRLQKHERALHHLARARLLAESIGLRHLQAKCLINLGYHYHCLGMADSALAVADAALRINDETPDLYSRVSAYEVRYTAFLAREDFENAFHSFSQYKVLSDSLNNQSARTRIEEFNARYQSAAKQHTIDLLEKDRALQAELLLRQELETRENTQQLDLLSRDLDIQRLRNAEAAAGMLRASDSLALIRQKHALQDERLSKEASVRAMLIGFVILLVILAFLGFRYIQQRRRQEMLRAEVAEYRVCSMEAHALKMQAENERREREAQEVFAHRLIASQEEERSRLAYALHDTLCQDLIVVKNRLQMALQNPDNEQHVLESIDTVASTLASVRSISHALRPFQIDEYGISSALQGVLKRIESNSSFRILSEIETIDGVLGKEQEVTVFRIAQEGLNNILKHADATEVVVRFRQVNGYVQLEIEDNGKGFDSSVSGHSGFGLHGISQRAKMLGASISIHSVPAKGTRLELKLPVPPTHETTQDIAEAAHV